MNTLSLLSTATILAAEEGEEVNETLHSLAPFLGITMFIVLVVLLIAALSFSSRGKRPDLGEYQDPSQLPADEQAMLDSVHAPVRH